MEPNDKVPGEQTIPSDRTPSSLDRDVGEEESTLSQCNLYQEVTDIVESSRMDPSHDIRRSELLNQRSEMTARDANNGPSQHSKFQLVSRAIAEFMGVAENDSSDEELDNIDHPDGTITDNRINNSQGNESHGVNGAIIINTSSKAYHRRISSHRRIWENRRYRLAARKYGGLKEDVGDIESGHNERLTDNSTNDTQDHPDGLSPILNVMPVHTKTTFIEYSKEAYLWLVKRCLGKHPIQHGHENYVPKSFSSDQSSTQGTVSVLDEEDEFFQNNVSSQDIVDDGGGYPGSVGLSRIRRSTLENMQDNSHRVSYPYRNGENRQYGIGIVGKIFGNKIHRGHKSRLSPNLHRSRMRQPLDDAEDYRPYFTYWISFVQIIIMIMSLIWYGVANFGVELSRVEGFVKTEKLTLDQVAYHEPSNFWLGPRAADLIHLGAKYAPCMRQDSQIENENYLRNIKESNNSGCCVRNDGSGCLQTTKNQCSKQLSTFYKWGGYYGSDKGPNGRRSGPVCGQDPRYCHSPASFQPHVWKDDITKWPICNKPATEIGLGNIPSIGSPPHVSCQLTGRPCCVGIHGKCEIRSAEYCKFVNGHFHPEATLCSQVSCMSDVCGMLSFGEGGNATDQVYRIWTSLFLHAGLVHLTVTLLVQYYLMRDLEKMCGPVRMGIIYLGSGIIGNAASAIFVPHRAESGPAGSHFGLLAALVVECINVWPLLRNPGGAMAKLMGVLIFLLLLGFLPWIDNYAHTFGFISGIILSFAFLPYLTFSNSTRSATCCSSILYKRKGRIWLIGICVTLSVLLLTCLLIIFYLGDIECEWCKYLSCIPFTDKFCADQNINLERSEIYLF